MELDAINGFRISSFWIPHYEKHRADALEMAMPKW